MVLSARIVGGVTPLLAKKFTENGKIMIKELIKNETSVWARLRTADKPVVLYGMGDGADKVLCAFKKYGIQASVVMASDEFVRGQSFHGFAVKKLNEVKAEFSDFIIALCFASQLPDVTDRIYKTAESFEVVVPSVPVFGDVLFDDDFVNRYSADIDRAYNLLADEKSKEVYKSVLKFYYTGDLKLLLSVTTPKDEAFKNILKLGSDETYVDLGAYNGDTVDEFLSYTGGKYKRIVALEPNEKNFEKLKAHCAGLKNAALWRIGAYNQNTELNFNNKAGRNSAIAESGVKTKVMRVDTLLCGMWASYVKADVEGADFETLEGMENTLKTFKPKLNFAAYHRFEDIFRLCLQISRINPEYKIYLRHHPYIPAWDTNLYCT